MTGCEIFFLCDMVEVLYQIEELSNFNNKRYSPNDYHYCLKSFNGRVIKHPAKYC